MTVPVWLVIALPLLANLFLDLQAEFL